MTGVVNPQTVLVGGATSGAGPLSTADIDWTPFQNKLILIAYSSKVGTGNISNPTITMTGGLGTWSVPSICGSASPLDKRGFVGVGTGATLSASGHLTFSVAEDANVNGGNWSIIAVDGAVLSSAAIVQCNWIQRKSGNTLPDGYLTAFSFLDPVNNLALCSEMRFNTMIGTNNSTVDGFTLVPNSRVQNATNDFVLAWYYRYGEATNAQFHTGINCDGYWPLLEVNAA